jgi:hypothetical protein
MNENIDSDSLEILLSVGRVFDKKSGMWFPTIKDEKSHDIDPMWVSAVLFLTLDRYLSNIPDEHQNDFYEKTLFYFSEMQKDGLSYVTKIDLKE